MQRGRGPGDIEPVQVVADLEAQLPEQVVVTVDEWSLALQFAQRLAALAELAPPLAVR